MWRQQGVNYFEHFAWWFRETLKQQSKRFLLKEKGKYYPLHFLLPLSEHSHENVLACFLQCYFRVIKTFFSNNLVIFKIQANGGWSELESGLLVQSNRNKRENVFPLGMPYITTEKTGWEKLAYKVAYERAYKMVNELEMEFPLGRWEVVHYGWTSWPGVSGLQNCVFTNSTPQTSDNRHEDGAKLPSQGQTVKRCSIQLQEQSSNASRILFLSVFLFFLPLPSLLEHFSLQFSIFSA